VLYARQQVHIRLGGILGRAGIGAIQGTEWRRGSVAGECPQLTQVAVFPHFAQSSSASRFTAGASGFLNFSQSGERPDR